MISIKLNGELLMTQANILLSDFLQQQNYTEGTYAIALNQQFVPRTHYANTQLQAADEIHLIIPMQGG